jgi:cytochrome c-type biogenesis protein CcmF
VGPPYYERTTGPLFAALLLLMGVAPLAAWRAGAARRLGRAFWKPALVAGLLPAGALLSGITQLAALLGLWLAALVACVTLYEFYRGAQARARITSSGFWLSFAQLVLRNRRRYGGFTIHLGVVLMAFAIIGIELFQSETQATLSYGEQLSIGKYQLRYDSLVEFPASDGRVITRATLNVTQDGRLITQLFPRRDFFTDSQQPMTIPAIHSTLADDLYVLLVGWEPAGAGGATFKVYVNPLVNWLWAGGLVFIIGTLVATWPERWELQTAAERARALHLPARSVTRGV